MCLISIRAAEFLTKSIVSYLLKATLTHHRKLLEGPRATCCDIMETLLEVHI
jgi:hypothetical protein